MRPPVERTTTRLTVDVLLEGLLGGPLQVSDRVITEAAIDSRLVIPGSLFVALPGEQVDGHDFVDDAFQRGALLALIDRPLELEAPIVDLRHKPRQLSGLPLPCALRVKNTLLALQAIARHWRAQLDVRVIGITGSVGKSTTKEVAADLLQRRFRTHRNPGNLNNEIGLPLSLLQLNPTHERTVLEMGFYVPGEIALLCDIARPQVGVITNVSQVHLERAGSLQAIIQGKRELVESLPPAPEGTAILNYDEPEVLGMSEHTRAAVFHYGLSEQADLWASDIQGLGLEGVRFVLHHQGERFHVRVPMLGRHSVHTALRAAAVGLVEGMTWDEILAGLQRSHSQLRLVAVSGPGGSLLLDDTYNAAPPSVIAALNLLEELEGRRVAVLGDMLELGEFEERGHRMVGARAAEVVQALITVGPRAHWIGEEAVRAGLPPDRLTELQDSQQAIEHLKDRIGAGDVVLIKGSRGMRMDRIVAALETRE
jgi:UDP-N-acetylmuramoyl-tripeptide--D-alanyl-D-alanine ligase